MSKIALTPNASGTGVFTIASPNSNTDRTLTLPDEAGTVLTSASTTVLPKGVPAFYAYQSSNQSITGATNVKVNLEAERYDYGGFFDSTTNYRFQPTTAGLYQITGCVQTNGGAIYLQTMIFKNGVREVLGAIGNSYYQSLATGLVYLNGSTDYVELYVYGGVSFNSQNGAPFTFLCGVLVRAE